MVSVVAELVYSVGWLTIKITDLPYIVGAGSTPAYTPN